MKEKQSIWQISAPYTRFHQIKKNNIYIKNFIDKKMYPQILQAMEYRYTYEQKNTFSYHG